MGNRVYCFLCLLSAMLIPGMSIAQNEVLSKIPAKAATYEAFIPKGFEVLGEATGDLNKDNNQDVVLALRNTAAEMESSDMDTDPRRLLLILFKKDGVYELACKADNALMTVHSGGVYGDPFEELKITNGVLVLYHYGGSNWRWQYVHKFRYQKGSFNLVGRTYDSYWTVKQCDDEFASIEYADINLVTGQIEIKKTSENCKILTHKIKKVKVKPLTKLENFDIDKEVDVVSDYLK